MLFKFTPLEPNCAPIIAEMNKYGVLVVITDEKKLSSCTPNCVLEYSAQQGHLVQLKNPSGSYFPIFLTWNGYSIVGSEVADRLNRL